MKYLIQRNSLSFESIPSLYTYRTLKDSTGRRWFIPKGKFAADGIFIEGNNDDSGCNGKIVSFTLEDGTIEKIKGPWLSYPKQLYDAFGIDFSNKHYSYVVIGADVEKSKHWNFDEYIIDIIHKDQEPIETNDPYKRGLKLAKEICNTFKIPVYLYVRSSLNYSCSWIYPDQDGPLVA